jgi:hypothetical protein
MNYFERPGVMTEMDEDVWSQSEATPVGQHFPPGKGGLPAGDWRALNPGTTFDPPVNHMMIDPLLLGSGAAYPTMHAEMPREELMYAMNGMYHNHARSTTRTQTAHIAPSVYGSGWFGRGADGLRHASHSWP